MMNPAMKTPTARLATTAVSSTSASAAGTTVNSKRTSTHRVTNITTPNPVWVSARPVASAASKSVRGVSVVQAAPSVPRFRSVASALATVCMIPPTHAMTTMPTAAKAR